MKVLTFITLCIQCVLSFSPYKKIEYYQVSGQDYGEPVFLTKYLEKHDVEGAREASFVPPMVENVFSYAGYFTVNKTHNSNLFFWYFPAEDNLDRAPVVVWLQGGPGASSMYGLFTEHGPLRLINGEVKLYEHRWTKFAHMIYIDNPVGTGFSFTDKDGYSTDETMVGNNLHEAIRQFFQVFPDLKKNDFFVTGESYGGKYVPAMAYTIHEKNKLSHEKLNLKGFAIGNGLCDPINMLNYGKHLNELGLIDSPTKLKFERIQNKLREHIKKEEYVEAFETFDTLLNGDLTPYPSLFANVTGFSFYFNFLHTKDNSDADLGKFFQKDTVRKSIHVGNLTFNSGRVVEQHLVQDVMKSIKPWFEVLIEKYRVLIYNGQLDIIVAYPLTLDFLQTVNWSGSQAYKRAQRKKWYVDSELAGYYKTVKGFTEVLVRNAGHMVPSDQPVWAFDLMERFLYNKPM
ncbi:venom serine carboxypeptidase-like [Cimex lectularius]|uniref:Carboxypeptidase n=1 Tax=Cimex lectularius TaxID=79782 RepID=A0A8I6RW82_CIMLE|nr:venom serine carboxypeptidase-like [Cimex lectularius]